MNFYYHIMIKIYIIQLIILQNFLIYKNFIYIKYLIEINKNVLKIKII
jgi:hypothetical protein